MAENEDWWDLCYDTDTGEFYVEHRWSYVQINGLKTSSGTEKHDAEAWTGPGAEKIPALKEQFLAQS
tara:strand:+ start:1472 stop:1672 length:201 start_codon:yes stop_codon:yes gene_type:complete